MKSDNGFTQLGLGMYRSKTYDALLALSESLAFDYMDLCLQSAIYVNYTRMTEVSDAVRSMNYEHKLMSLVRTIQEYERLVEPLPWYRHFNAEEIALIRAKIAKRIQELEQTHFQSNDNT